MINLTVVNEMLTHRGYTIDEDQEHEDLIIAERNDNPDEKICVFKEVFEKLNKQDYISCANRLNELEIQHGIIVYNKITSAVTKVLLDVGDVSEKGIKCHMEVFESHQLLFNPCKHSLTPIHTRVSDDEAKVLRESYDSSKFPIIKSTDPIVRFLAFKKGDIIKIVRKTGFVAYRNVR